MWTLARKNLFKERARLAISIGGVAFAVALMILLRGLYLAYEHKVGDFYNAMDVSAWVVQTGTADMLQSYSVLPSSLETDHQRDRRRRRGHPLHGTRARLQARTVATWCCTSRASTRRPAARARARCAWSRARRRSATMRSSSTRSSRTATDWSLGDRIDILDQELTVAGISAGGDVVMFQYGFVTNRRARSLLQSKGLVNAFLIRLEPDASLQAVAKRLKKEAPKTIVKSTATVIRENERIVKEGFLPVLGVLLVIGFCVGVAVIGLTIYSAVLEHRREYGVLKALGARPVQMLMVVAVQALGAAACGYIAGLAVSLLAARAAEIWVPQFITLILPADVALVGLAALLMGLIAAVIPLRNIARVDPAIVFRS